MAGIAKLYDWNGKRMTAKQIAELECVSEAQVYNYLKANYKQTSDIRFRRKHNKAPVIVAARPKLDTSANLSPVNENHIVRIRHIQLHDMLNYLAKSCKTTYQTAFEEFCNYIYEGRLWSKKADKDAIAELKKRILKRNNMSANGVTADDYEYPEDAKPRGKLLEMMDSYISELEAERNGYRFELEKLRAKVRAFLGELED